MKLNQPVTDKEIQVSEAETLVSKTDLKGMITYVNDAFIKISGYSESELLGQSHNIIRHPDMPSETFADLWSNCKAGKPWSGVVKNCCKNGDYYWVLANVVPIFERNQLTGYGSLRSKPTRQQIETAEKAYRLFKVGKAQGLKINQGNVVNNNLIWRARTMFQKLNVGARLNGLIGLGLLVAITLGALGLVGMGQSQDSLRTVYADRMVPLRDLGLINELMVENRTLLRTVLSEVEIASPAGVATAETKPTLAMNAGEASKAAEAMAKNIDQITKLWDGYMATYLTPEEKILADQFIVSRGKFVQEAVKPVMLALQSNNYAESRKLADKAKALFQQADADLEKLKNLQLDVADSEYKAGVSRYENIRMVNVGLLGGSIALLIWLGLLVTRSIVRPLNQAISVFGNMSNGKFDSVINVTGEDEVSKVLSGLKTMQTKLGFDIDETKRMLNENTRIRNALDFASTGMLIADRENNIIYMNKAVAKTLSTAETDFKKVLPQFDANKILGASVDIFHKNPEHQKQLLATLKSSHVANMEVGNRTLKLTATPVFDAEGGRLGTALEWIDRTAEVAIEKEIAAVVNAASKGDLTERIYLDGKEGFFLNFSTAINTLTNSVEQVVKETVNGLSRMSKGDLRQPISGDFEGSYKIIKDSCNATMTRLTDLIDEMNHMSREHDAGDIDVFMDVKKFQGDFGIMAKGVNEMVTGHINVKKKAIAVFKAFGEGNFDAPMEQLPGKKAFVNEAVELVRSNLKAVIADTDKLSLAAAAGELDTRADASKHQGDFRTLVDGINHTLDAVIGPINE
ncbi:MAG: Tar ligand binding domain-containing protein, partial [Methylococcales bacterium]